MHLGDSAPVTREGAGAVAPDSLAAESATFTHSNRNAAPGSGPAQTSGKVSAPGEGLASAGGTSGSLENQQSYAGAAPSYVNRLYQADRGGPKGKNLKEVESFGGGAKQGDPFAAEVGGEMDPGRAAEARFGLQGEGEGEEGGKKAPAGNERFAGLEETSA